MTKLIALLMVVAVLCATVPAQTTFHANQVRSKSGNSTTFLTANGAITGTGSTICSDGAGNGTTSGCAAAAAAKHGISFTIGDPAGSALSAASTTTRYITVPFACTIAGYNLLVDAGTITVKFWKIATGTAIPTSANSINTSGVSISSGTAIHSATLSDFTTTTVTANDIIAMNVTVVATAKFVNGVLECNQ